jgi:hypothetical protein
MIDRLGGRCHTCGCSDPAKLTFDHIHGGGNVHRRESGRVTTHALAAQEKDPSKKFRLLCRTCHAFEDMPRILHGVSQGGDSAFIKQLRSLKNNPLLWAIFSSDLREMVRLLFLCLPENVQKDAGVSEENDYYHTEMQIDDFDFVSETLGEAYPAFKFIFRVAGLEEEIQA